MTHIDPIEDVVEEETVVWERIVEWTVLMMRLLASLVVLVVATIVPSEPIEIGHVCKGLMTIVSGLLVGIPSVTTVAKGKRVSEVISRSTTSHPMTPGVTVCVAMITMMVWRCEYKLHVGRRGEKK